MTPSTESPLPAKHPEIEALRTWFANHTYGRHMGREFLDVAERRMDELAVSANILADRHAALTQQRDELIASCNKWQATADRLLRERDEYREEIECIRRGQKFRADPVEQDRYERAYLAALTGLLASGECQSFTSASIDADTCAKLALAAFEARAKERG